MVQIYLVVEREKLLCSFKKQSHNNITDNVDVSNDDCPLANITS